MIRARRVEHLVALIDQYELLQAATILETPDIDYPARIVVARDAWIVVLTEITRAVDYPNFKSAVSAQGHTDAAYLDALHAVWSRMLEYQRESRGTR